MITQIEIDGFKTFRDFKLELAPFTVIIGANGAGKSNLFDALRLLSRLAETDLATAFQDTHLRGTPMELFTLLPGGERVTRMRFAVEMLVDRHVRSGWDGPVDLQHTRLRYEIEVTRRLNVLGLEELNLTHESLRAIRYEEDTWFRRYVLTNQDLWLPARDAGRDGPFISDEAGAEPFEVRVHPDQDGLTMRNGFAHGQQAALSYMVPPAYSHLIGARQELRSLRFLLQLNPVALRQSGSTLGHPSLSTEGNGLTSLLAHLASQDQYLLGDVSRKLSHLVPDIDKIEVEMDKARGEYLIWARTFDGRLFSSRVLADGTLRLLALITLVYDPQFRGVLCLEEPENGVHPLRLPDLADLFKRFATDFADPQEAEHGLHQLLINTQSPLLIAHLFEQLSEESGPPPRVVFAHLVTRVQPGGDIAPMRVTRMVPVPADRQMRQDLDIQDSEAAYSLRQVLAYLNAADLKDVRDRIEGTAVG